jgi:hypothetical protein
MSRFRVDGVINPGYIVDLNKEFDVLDTIIKLHTIKIKSLNNNYFYFKRTATQINLNYFYIEYDIYDPFQKNEELLSSFEKSIKTVEHYMRKAVSITNIITVFKSRELTE